MGEKFKICGDRARDATTRREEVVRCECVCEGWCVSGVIKLCVLMVCLFYFL